MPNHHLYHRDSRPHRNIVVGRRLKLARMAMGWGERQGRFAQAAGISLTAYNQWESGENYPGVDNAIKLCEKHVGLTLDWIYRGNMDGMPTRLSSAIQVLGEVMDEAKMTKIEDGGPAYPMAVAAKPDGDTVSSHSYGVGMSLRDRFALEAIPALISIARDMDLEQVEELFGKDCGGITNERIVAEMAYRQADAMLARRIAERKTATVKATDTDTVPTPPDTPYPGLR